MDIDIVYNDSINVVSITHLTTEIRNAAAQNPTKIKLWLTTDGGEIYTAFVFYDWIRANNFPIEVIGFNKIKSSGIIVYLAFENRFFKSKAEFLFHQVYIDEARRTPTTSAQKHEELNARMLDVISTTLNLPDVIASTLGNYKVDIIVKDEVELNQFGIGTITPNLMNNPIVIRNGAVERP